MKLSTRARYALRMMVEIAKLTNRIDDTVSLAKISDVTNISRRYLEQLAIVLKSHSLIRSKTGKGGGYQLARPASEIPASEIIEATIGPINIVDCVLDPDTCPMADDCGCRSVYCDINSRIVSSLSDLTLDKLAEKHRN
ncbi:MAG: Rrf2 family transcriptional regulator [Myxococcota bacterium]|nr:Rrf2 family transcriptional regulator [Myxococcota bacterium]